MVSGGLIRQRANRASETRVRVLLLVTALVAMALLVPAAAHATISGASAYPNPVTPNGDGWADFSYVNFSLSTASRVTVKIYDLDWRLMAVPCDRRALAAGFHSVRFAAQDTRGQKLPDGVYWYSVQRIGADNSLVESAGGLLFVASQIRIAPVVPGSAPSLASSWVNPNPGTTESSPAVRYRLTTDAYVTLKVYDRHGEMRTILYNAFRGAGEHAQVWDGRDTYGELQADGTYRYMLFATSGGQKPYTHLRSGTITLKRGIKESWRVYADDDWRIMTTDRWGRHASSVYLDGSYQCSFGTGSTYNVSFRGSGFEWIGPKGPQLGKARVFLNGVSHGVVDLRASTLAPRTSLWRVTGLDPSRTHSVTIKLVRDSTSTTGALGVDAIRVLGGSGLVPAAPRGSVVFGYSAPELMVIDKSDFRLYQVRGGVLTGSYPVAIGRTNAETPVGTWKILSKYYTDPAGIYGPRKMRMYRQVGTSFRYTAYNLHGTNQPWVIGTKASAGCIRMYNADVLGLFPTVQLGTTVVTRE